MPSLVSTTERAILTGIFNNIFDTFQRPIIIYKEPIKTSVSVSPASMVFGFGESQGEDNFNYTEVSGIYPAVIRYQEQITDLNGDLNAFLSAGTVHVKVRGDCRDFINQGKNEKFVVDGRTFYLDGDEKKQTFLDSEFYIFSLKATK
jgi:hypothetical protein